MALYIPHSIFRLARLLYVKPETFGPYYVFERRITTTVNTVRSPVTSWKWKSYCVVHPLSSDSYVYRAQLGYNMFLTQTQKH